MATAPNVEKVTPVETPAKAEKVTKKPVSAYIPVDLYDKLDAHSFDIRERKLSNIVIKALEEYVEKHVTKA